MGIFSASPKPFTIHRKSMLASELKFSISRKLLEFLGNYTDDVLAEYITVLVCNGKHQYQARNDLEAFLGEKSEEFVSWLWDLLIKYAHESNRDIGLSDLKDVTVTSSHDSDADKDTRSDKLSDLSNHGTGHAHGSLVKTKKKEEKIHHLSNSTCDPVSSINMVQHNPDSAAPLNQVITNKVGPQTCQNQIPRRVGATEKIDNDLTYKSLEKGGSLVVSGGREQSVQCMENYTKIGNSKCNRLLNQPSSIPKGEPVSRNSRSSTSDYPCPKQAFSTDVSGRSLSPRSMGLVTHQIEKSRGSVWDRLGKPSDNTPAGNKTVNSHCVSNMKKDDKILNQQTLKPPMLNGELRMKTLGRVPGPGYRCGRNTKPMENRKLNSEITTCKPNVANNIKRKRHFGEITTIPSSGSLVEEGNKEISQDSGQAKHPKASTKTLVTEVLDVRQRLAQIEMEVSKLRSRQAEMEREEKPNLLLQSGALKHPKDDIESRTVTVTNVHFAATKEAISLHFTKCGRIVNIEGLMDKATGQPKGTAHISFANKESVEKAVALSGTTFFSRTIKVFKKAEAADATSGSAQLAGQPSKATSFHINRMAIPYKPYHSSSHLQWRRESVSSPSEAIAPKAVASSASQQLPSTIASERTSEANPSSREPPAVA